MALRDGHQFGRAGLVRALCLRSDHARGVHCRYRRIVRPSRTCRVLIRPHRIRATTTPPGTPLDRVLTPRLVSVLAPSYRECQRDTGRTLAPATTGSRARSPSPIRHANERSHTVATVAIKPLEDRVVVKPLDAEQTTASGLVIPDTAKEKPQEGVVIAVGPGRYDDAGTKRVPMDVKVGDVVLYSKYGGTEVKFSGEEYLVLSARDVLAIIEK